LPQDCAEKTPPVLEDAHPTADPHASPPREEVPKEGTEVKVWHRWDALRAEGPEGVASHIVNFFQTSKLGKVPLLIFDGSNVLHGGKAFFPVWANESTHPNHVVVVIKRQDYTKVKSSVYSLLSAFHHNQPMLCLDLNVKTCDHLTKTPIPCIEYDHTKTPTQCTIRHTATTNYGPNHKYCEFDDVACTQLKRVLNTKISDIAHSVSVVSNDQQVVKSPKLINEFNTILDEWAGLKMDITLYKFEQSG
jgi:hypothetical protein